MRIRSLTFLVLATLIAIAVVFSSGMPPMAQAQVVTATSAGQVQPPATLAATVPPDQLSITSPVPVTELWSSVEVRGTASIPNMARYVIEIANLPADLILPPDVTWLSISEQAQ